MKGEMKGKGKGKDKFKGEKGEKGKHKDNDKGGKGPEKVSVVVVLFRSKVLCIQCFYSSRVMRYTSISQGKLQG